MNILANISTKENLLKITPYLQTKQSPTFDNAPIKQRNVESSLQYITQFVHIYKGLSRFLLDSPDY